MAEAGLSLDSIPGLDFIQYLRSIPRHCESAVDVLKRYEKAMPTRDNVPCNRKGNHTSNFSEAGMRRKRLDWETWVRNLSDHQFRVFYRMTQSSFFQLLTLLRPSLIRNELQGNHGCPNGIISPELQLSMAIRWLAGGSYLDIHHFHGVSQAGFFYSKNNVLLAIRQCPELQIVYPSLTDKSTLNSIASGFKQKSTNGVFDKCIGAVDGILIELHCVKGPEAIRAARYWTRKSCFALNVQAVCDSSRRFLWYNVESPGSTHDSMAFSKGNLAAHLASINIHREGMYLVGDAAYKGVPGIITPFDGVRLPVWQDSYNFHQSQLRINIECAFGMLINRWGVFWRGLRTDSMEIAISVIGVCLQLHNFILERDNEYAAPLYDIIVDEEHCSHIHAKDRLSAQDRPEMNEHGAPIHRISHSPLDYAADEPDSRSIRANLMLKLEHQNMTRPSAPRRG